MLDLPAWQWWRWGLAGGCLLVGVVAASFWVWWRLRDDHEYEAICGFFTRVLAGVGVGFLAMSPLGLGWLGSVWGAGWAVVWGTRLFERLSWQAAEAVWPGIWAALMVGLAVYGDWWRLLVNVAVWLIWGGLRRWRRRWHDRKLAAGVDVFLGLWLAVWAEVPFAIGRSWGVYLALAVGMVIPPVAVFVRSSDKVKCLWQRIKRKKGPRRIAPSRF